MPFSEEKWMTTKSHSFCFPTAQRTEPRCYPWMGGCKSGSQLRQHDPVLCWRAFANPSTIFNSGIKRSYGFYGSSIQTMPTASAFPLKQILPLTFPPTGHQASHRVSHLASRGRKMVWDQTAHSSPLAMRREGSADNGCILNKKSGVVSGINSDPWWGTGIRHADVFWPSTPHTARLRRRRTISCIYFRWNSIRKKNLSRLEIPHCWTRFRKNQASMQAGHQGQVLIIHRRKPLIAKVWHW